MKAHARTCVCVHACWVSDGELGLVFLELQKSSSLTGSYWKTVWGGGGTFRVFRVYGPPECVIY